MIMACFSIAQSLSSSYFWVGGGLKCHQLYLAVGMYDREVEYTTVVLQDNTF